MTRDTGGLQSIDAVDVDRIHSRSMTFLEANVALQGVRDHQDIRKQDGCVKSIATDRLQRHLDGKIGRVTEIEEAPGDGTRRTIFRKVSASLAHEPDGRRTDRLPLQNLQNFPSCLGHGWSLPIYKQRYLDSFYFLESVGIKD
ncbi:hypothetical protein D9M72_546910 [compost metagenome]